MDNIERILKLNGYVGFDSIARQLVKKSLKTGFSFNILCIGPTGSGKSTLIDTLFNTRFENTKIYSHAEKNVSLSSSTYNISENNVNLKLTVIETIGFGDQVNQENSYEIISNYINSLFEINLQQELEINRNFNPLNDKLIHLCLYFILPTGHSLKSIDLLTMKSLDDKINIVPVIAKSDIITKNELMEFKAKIRQELVENDIKIYKFPIDDYDSNINKLNQTINEIIPFAVVGSNELIKIGSRLVKGRSYKWGTVIVENENHCDFVKLREMLLATNMLDLIELTHAKHYQSYKTKRLKEMGYEINDDKATTIFDLYRTKRDELLNEIQQREFEIKENFVKKVKDKENEIKLAEKEIQNKLILLKQQNTEQKSKLDEKRIKLELEIQEFRLKKMKIEQSKFGSTISLSKPKRK